MTNALQIRCKYQSRARLQVHEMNNRLVVASTLIGFAVLLVLVLAVELYSLDRVGVDELGRGNNISYWSLPDSTSPAIGR